MTEKVDVTLSVPKEWHEMLGDVADIALKLYEPLSDGVDLSDVDDLVSVVPELWSALRSADEAFEGVKEDPAGAAAAGFVFAQKLYDGIRKVREQKGK